MTRQVPGCRSRLPGGASPYRSRPANGTCFGHLSIPVSEPRLFSQALRVALAVVVLAACVPAAPSIGAVPHERVQFNRDIRPLLSENCYSCHGPDPHAREADLRLDVQEGALAALGGYHPIVPGKPDASEIYLRICEQDDSMRMPPPESGKTLTPAQIDLIRRWIAEGAPWQGHWSFLSPKRPQVPATDHDAWSRNPIDHFVLRRLQKEGLQPAPEADKQTLIRRVTLDLTGLPPALEEIDAFLADSSREAYEKLVDRLLASPRYGEQMTRYLLDAARYGDTHGLHLDNERSIWLYRDWLIRAFNENKPFDQFTTEQLAGDLLPEPTVEQRIATGFNRCNVTTSEGGSIDEEYIVRYAVDRTETMSTVWMGLTTGCAACHDHKFDPITQKEFYQLYAFFNSTADKPMDGNALLPPPILKVPSAEQVEKQKQLAERREQIDKQIQAELTKIDYTDPQTGEDLGKVEPQQYVWIDDSLPAGAQPAGDGQEPWQWVAAPEHPVLSGERSTVRTAEGRSQHFFTGAKAGLKIDAQDKLFAHVYLDPQTPPAEIMLQFNDGAWEHRAFWGEDRIDWGKPGTASRRPMGPLPEPGKWVRLEVEAAKVGLKGGAVLNGWAFTQFGGTVHWDKAGVTSVVPKDGAPFDSLLVWDAVQRAAKAASLPEPVKQAVLAEPGKRTGDQNKRIREYFLEHVYPGTRATFAPLHQQLDEVKKQQEELEKAIPATLVTEELPKPRDAHVLRRGEYDKPQEKVERGVPAVLPPLPEGAPKDRLGLAQWLVSPSHPLTARVTVNRFWQRYFGAGIVKTAEDFGVQGQWPSHPELLDWLAVEFIESGWNVKRMQKRIVTSAAYRQSSRITPELYRRDPENRLLARGPRFRMDAEMVRDNALAISGLLVGAVGGPSVKPYQPPGLWEAVGYTTSNTAKFAQDHGEALYRRSMYTFWKRTAPPPTMLLLDAPSRETCTARRPRTNTPSAALALMNDVQFFEAARSLAERMLKQFGSQPEERIAAAFRLATARPPDAEELAALVEQYQAQLAEYRGNPEAAKKAVAIGESKPDASLDPVELVAWTMVANVILNLDETITKR